MKQRVFIYTLNDPDTNEIRYVGKTTNTAHRLRTHLSSAKKPKTYVQCWIKNLLVNNKIPIIVIIAECSKKDWAPTEIRYIKEYKDAGHRLTNLAEGGKGFPLKYATKSQKSAWKGKIKNTSLQREYTDDDRQRMAYNARKHHTGTKHTAATKRKIANALKGPRCYNYGKHLSQHTKDLLSKAGKNRIQSEASKKKISKKAKKRSVVQLSKDVTFIKKWKSTIDAERGLKTTVHHANISACCKGRLKQTGGFKWMYTEDWEELK